MAAFPDRPCLAFHGKKYTYREVGELVARAAKGLSELGVGKGARVGLFLPNSPYFVICYYAILKAGGTVVNFNPLYAEREIARQIEDSGVRVMVTMNLGTLHSKIAGRFADTCLETIVTCRMRGALPFHKGALFALLKRKEIAAVPADGTHVEFEKLIANDGVFETPAFDPGRDVAVLQYTGGTTGRPKGAMLTHANLYINTVQTRNWAPGITPGEERFLAVLPLFHVFGMTGVMNVALYIGAEIVLLPRFKINEVLKVIGKTRPTVLMGVPTIYSTINGHKESTKYDLSSLDFCISGGAPLPLQVKNTFERLTGCTLVEGYGLTEAGPVCTVNPLAGVNKPGSAGLPIPGTIIEVVSIDRPNKTVPLGEHGEICVSGPQVMAGYWNREDETSDVIRNGRLHTGDVGYMDEDGYVYLVDRIKDMIITGGFNVYPRMVEEAIYLHPAVEEAAVCGIPSQHRGEIVKAYVKLRDGAELTAAELRAFLEDKLAPFEMPRRVEFRDEIPKTLVGKPLRRELIAEELRRQKRRKTRTTTESSADQTLDEPDPAPEAHEGSNAA
ncbi:MAG: long-chain fatty acid--CoA ligase [Alphaproteobacteria bacterium]